MSSENNSEIGEHIGRVKWFNNQRGFGFVSFTQNGEEKDIFVHHSGIRTQAKDSFKTLKPGEYISFNVSKCLDSSKGHQEQATCVTGVNGGPLLVDCQQTIREERKNKQHESHSN